MALVSGMVLHRNENNYLERAEAVSIIHAEKRHLSL